MILAPFVLMGMTRLSKAARRTADGSGLHAMPSYALHGDRAMASSIGFFSSLSAVMSRFEYTGQSAALSTRQNRPCTIRRGGKC
jgi:hypothetical protein